MKKQLFGLAFLAYLTLTADPGLLGEWKFDAKSGRIGLDSSGNANDADIIGPQSVRGAFGDALEFDGKGAHVVIPRLGELDNSSEMTLSAWVLWKGTGQYPNILSGGTWSPGGFMLFVNNESCAFRMGRPGHKYGRPGDQWRESSTPFIDPLPRNQWVHLAVTFKQPEITTYVNGKKAASSKWDYPVGQSGDITLGRWGGKQSHNGLLDDVSIYKRGLSPAEIAELYASGKTGRDSTAYTRNKTDLSSLEAIATFENEVSHLKIDSFGQIISLFDKIGKKELLTSPGSLGALWLENGKRRVQINRLIPQKDGRFLCKFRGTESTAILRIQSRKRHFRIDVEKLEGNTAIRYEFLRISPTCNRYRGNMIGMLSDDHHGVCLRALNLDTRVLANASSVSAQTYEEYGLHNGSVALIAAPRELLLPILKEVTKKEEQPISKAGGAWAQKAEINRGSYLFSEVSEANVDDWIDLARRGGITDIHLHGWWKNLGHYDPRPSRFPDGLDSLKRTVEKIHDAGLYAGIHTLTGCIDTRDPWVTPKADPRLASDASYTLAKPLTATEKEVIYLNEAPQKHDVVFTYSGGGNALRLGSEIILYSEISQDPPAFRKLTRGAFKTIPAAYLPETKVDHLKQRYLAFYPADGSTLLDELAQRIAKAYNYCKMDEIYFDGSEGSGNWHAIDATRNAIFNKLKIPAQSEASCWGHHNWWFHSRLGAWDHPKWAPKQFTDMHIAHAEDIRRNELLATQLGWWALVGPSSISRGFYPEEVEYFIGKVAAIDTAMSLQGVRPGTRSPSALQEQFMTTIGWYERLRLSRYFTRETFERLRPAGKEFRLRQDEEGEWKFRPLTVMKRKPTAIPASWTIHNPEPTQALRLRVEALYEVAPYNNDQAVLLTDFRNLKDFHQSRASGVTQTVADDDDDVSRGGQTIKWQAKNQNAEPKAAWARYETSFTPYLNIGANNALGFWLHGDGSGAVLNVQLSSPREHHHCYAEHYVDVNFTGWRYIAIPFRERSSERYHDYKWPYYSQHGIFRNPINRSYVSNLRLYLINIPKDGETNIAIGPIKTLPISKRMAKDLTLSVNGSSSFAIPPLYSGEYIEIDEMNAVEIHDERGMLKSRLPLPAELPQLLAGENRISLGGTAADRCEVTFFSLGAPFGKRNPDDKVQWRWLKRNYACPRDITQFDGHENRWIVKVRPEAKKPRLGLDISMLAKKLEPVLYDDPSALHFAPANDPSIYEASQKNQYAKFASDGTQYGIRAGVTHKLEPETEIAKSATALRYTAVSKRDDSGGWSAKGRRFSPPLDLSAYAGLGFHLHGDGKGESFKVQLRDTKGLWHDMVTRIDFSGWKYVSFEWANLKLDPSQIEYLLVYYNGIPANKTVSCVFDDFRALRIPPRQDAIPVLTVNGESLSLPVLQSGQTLRIDDSGTTLMLPGSLRKPMKPIELPLLKPGANEVELKFKGEDPDQPRLKVSTVVLHGE